MVIVLYNMSMTFICIYKMTANWKLSIDLVWYVILTVKIITSYTLYLTIYLVNSKWLEFEYK